MLQKGQEPQGQATRCETVKKIIKKIKNKQRKKERNDKQRNSTINK